MPRRLAYSAAIIPAALGLLCLVLAYCAHAADFDPHRYLSQYQCPDGGFPYNCPEAQRQPATVAAPMLYEKADWGQPGGWAHYDSFWWPGSKFHATIWPWSPEFGKLADNENNGGEVYEIVDGRPWWVRILFTTDYGSRKQNPDGNQYFNVCDVQGWGLFDQNVPSGRWAEHLYGQRGGLSPGDCSGPVNYGFTRTRKESVSMPVMFNGQPYDRRMNVIFSEQYDNRSVAQANRVERFAFMEWLGRGFWALCLRSEQPDWSYRLPQFAFAACPDGFNLADVRYAMQFMPIDPAARRTPLSYGWPFK